MMEQESGGGGKVTGESAGGGILKHPCATASATTTTTSASAGSVAKPTPMKLFSTWEVEKSTPSCVPRLCSLTLSRLIILKPLEHELHSLTIAIKMQSSKFVLHSNEVVLPANGILDTDLDLSFSLLYPHFLKQDGNLLQILLQRRKKYKNRSMLGYKTLASGHVNMSQVLQHPTNLQVSLYRRSKEHGKAVALVTMLSLCSQPVDQEAPIRITSADPDRSPGDISEEDDVHDDQEDSSNDYLSDVDNLTCDDEPAVRRRKSHPISSAFASRQRILKQKFASLLRRFKFADEAVDVLSHDANEIFVDELFEEVETLSDSDLDIDTVSIQSTPKPRLKPFFTGQFYNGSHQSREKPVGTCQEMEHTGDQNNSRVSDSDTSQLNVLESRNSDSKGPTTQQVLGSEHKGFTATEKRLRASPKFVRKGVHRKRSSSIGDGKLQNLVQAERRCSVSTVSNEPQRVLLDQVVAILSSDDILSECIILISHQENQVLVQAIQNTKHHVICTFSPVDVKAVLSATVNRIQKYCCKKSLSVPMKLVVVGSDSYISSVLKSYVELISSKSPEWLNYLRFLVIPFGYSFISKTLAALDVKYGALFNDSFWKENVIERSEVASHVIQASDLGEVVLRINRYLSSATHLVQLPLAEAILTHKDKGSDDTTQLIVPFVGEVRLGPADTNNSSPLGSIFADTDDVPGVVPLGPSGSPPQTNAVTSDRLKDIAIHGTSVAQHTNTSYSSHSGSVPSGEGQQEGVDLQIDYWLNPSKADAAEKEKGDRLAKKELKYSLKMMFKSMQVFRPLQHPGQQLPLVNDTVGVLAPGLSMVIVTREKKQKMMRIGKKSKESDPNKSQQIDGIGRLICTSKSQSHLLRVSIDGVDWTGVKFFQVSSQWQTHLKHFPVLLFSPADISATLTAF